MLPVPTDEDMKFALCEYSRVFGGRPMSQASLKAAQALPLAFAALSVKERGQMGKEERERASSKCMQEIAVPGFIKLVLKMEEELGHPLAMPHKWKDMLYNTTLGTGVYLLSFVMRWYAPGHGRVCTHTHIIQFRTVFAYRKK